MKVKKSQQGKKTAEKRWTDQWIHRRMLQAEEIMLCIEEQIFTKDLKGMGRLCWDNERLSYVIGSKTRYEKMPRGLACSFEEAWKMEMFREAMLFCLREGLT